MSFEQVKRFFDGCGLGGRVMRFEVSSATVGLAAEAVGCEPARIAKTLSFLVGEQPVLIVTAGDARVDNKKYKQQFHEKARMLPHAEVEARVGHAPGGVCPVCGPRRGDGLPRRVAAALPNRLSGCRERGQRGAPVG